MFDVLVALAAARRTGVLEVRRGEVKSYLRFRDGRLLLPDGETLSAFLVRQGRLSREAVERADADRSEGEERVDAWLRTGVLDPEQARQAAVDYLDQFLAAIAGWASEETEFRPADPDDAKPDGGDAVECIERIAAVTRAAADPFELVPLTGDPGATLDPADPDDAGGLTLGSEEAYLLSRITPGCKVREIGVLPPFDAATTGRALAVLIAAGLVRGVHSPSYRYTARRKITGAKRRGDGSKRKKFSRSGGKKPAYRKPVATPANRTGLPPAAGQAGAGTPPPPEDLASELDKRIQSLESRNFYELLEVSESAGDDEIRHRYYDLARRFHPDRFQKTGELQMAEKAETLLSYITEAYSHLSNAGRRTAYNLHLSRQSDRTETRADPKQMARENCKAGMHLFRTGQLVKAIKFLENAVKLDPGNDQYLCHLAEVQLRNPRYRKEARQNLQQALELNPSNPDVLVQIGQLLEKEGKKDEAIKKYEEALSWDPTHQKAQELLVQSGGRRRRGLFRR